MASAAARAMASKKAMDKKNKARAASSGRSGGKSINRVYEIDDVDEEDRLRLGNDAGVNKALAAWRDGALNDSFRFSSHRGGDSDSDDDDVDLLERSIRDDDDVGCAERGKCCGRRHGAKCCTDAHKRRPYCMDMDEGRDVRWQIRRDGTRAYRVNKLFLDVVNSKVFGTLVLTAILCVTFLIGAGTYSAQSPALSTMENCVQAWFVV